jgi:hypothetical protein
MANGATPQVLPRRVLWDRANTVEKFDRIAEDLDEHDNWFSDIWREVNSIKRLLLGAMLTTTLAAVALAANLLVGRT